MKFMVVELSNGEVTGYVAPPYYNVTKDKAKALILEDGLSASMLAFELKERNRRDYAVKGVNDED